jgi:hypothetical protein
MPSAIETSPAAALETVYAKTRGLAAPAPCLDDAFIELGIAEQTAEPGAEGEADALGVGRCDGEARILDGEK